MSSMKNARLPCKHAILISCMGVFCAESLAEEVCQGGEGADALDAHAAASSSDHESGKLVLMHDMSIQGGPPFWQVFFVTHTSVVLELYAHSNSGSVVITSHLQGSGLCDVCPICTTCSH